MDYQKTMPSRSSVLNELHTTKELLDKIQRIGGVGSWSQSIKDNNLTWTDQTYKIFGLEPGADISFEKFLEMIHPDDRALLKSKTINSMQKGDEYNIEYRIINKDSGERIIREEAEIKYDKNGDILSLDGIIHDITERKIAEADLRKYELLFSHIKDLAYIIDDKGNILYVNKLFEELTNHAVEEFIGKPFAPLFDEENLKVATDGYTRTLQGESPQYSLHFKDTGILCEYKNIPMRDEKGNIIGVMGIGRDITERKKTEEKIMESRERYRSLLESITDGVVVLDHDSRYLLLNDRISEMTGVSKEEIFGNRIYDIFPGVKESELGKMIEEVLKTGSPGMNIQKWTYLDGRIKWYENHGYKVPEGIMIISTDISGRKKAEAALKKAHDDLELKIEERTTELNEEIKDRIEAEELLKVNEEKFRRVFEDSVIGMMLVNQDGRHVKANASMTKILGYSTEELLSKTMKEITYPGDLTTDSKIVRQLRSGKSNGISTEKRYRHKEGHIIWGHMYVSPIRDSNGKILFTVGQLTDISERKRAELGIKRQLMKYNLEDGSLYLVKEVHLRESRLCFNDLLKIGYKGLIFSRGQDLDLLKNIEGDFEYLQLSWTKGKKTIKPDLGKIKTLIEKQDNNSVVLLDRLDYLISKNGFKKTLNFIQNLAETTINKKYIVIISIDPGTLPKNELRLLEKETKKPEPHEGPNLPEDSLEILRFVYQENNKGSKPSYTNIGNTIGASRPTTRKRIQILINHGYVREAVKGNQKVVELTENGIRIFTK